jgi:hypothetical protein
MLTLTYLFEEESNKSQFKVPMIEKHKDFKLNPKTNRMKNFKTIKYLFTDIPPEKRTLKNLPRYANKKVKVRFQDWLEIDSKKLDSNDSVTTYGWAADGKCYGWSHRAVHGFSIGEIVKPDTIGNEGGKEYTIKTREQCEEAAKKFAREIS